MNGVSGKQLRSIDINLLQAKPRKAEAPPNNRLWVLVLSVGVAGLAALGWFGYDAKSEAARKEQEIKKVSAQIEEAKGKLSGVSGTGAVADFLALPDKIKALRPQPTVILDKLTKLLPQNANLSSLGFEVAKPGEGTPLKITGLFATTEDVVTFAQAVKSTTDFKFVGMSGLTKLPADANNKQAAADDLLPVIQVTFDLTYVTDAGKKGGNAS